MSDFLMDKAHMALMAKRYEEAQGAYEEILRSSYTVPAWTGLGNCKLFQLSNGQTIDEVLYCYDKARGVESANIEAIDKELLAYSTLVMNQYANFAIQAIEKAIQAEKDAAAAALISVAAIAVGAMSDGMTTKVLSGVAAGAAGAIAVGKFGEMTDMKEIATYCTEMLSSAHLQILKHLAENGALPEAIEFQKNCDALAAKVIESLPEHVRKAMDRRSANENSASLISEDTGVMAIKSFLENEGTSFNKDKKGPLFCLDEKVITGEIKLFKDTLLNPNTLFERLLDHLNDGESILFGYRTINGTIGVCFTSRGIYCGGGVRDFISYSDASQIKKTLLGTIKVGEKTIPLPGVKTITTSNFKKQFIEVLRDFVASR